MLKKLRHYAKIENSKEQMALNFMTCMEGDNSVPTLQRGEDQVFLFCSWKLVSATPPKLIKLHPVVGHDMYM